MRSLICQVKIINYYISKFNTKRDKFNNYATNVDKLKTSKPFKEVLCSKVKMLLLLSVKKKNSVKSFSKIRRFIVLVNSIIC